MKGISLDHGISILTTLNEKDKFVPRTTNEVTILLNERDKFSDQGISTVTTFK